MSLQGAGLRSDRGLDVRLVRFYNRPDAEEPAMLADDLLAAGRSFEAVQVVHIGLAIDPADAEIMVTGARAWLEEGQLDRAQLLLTRAASAEPAWAEPWKRLGELLLERGRHDKAARILERARALEPADCRLDTVWRQAERRNGVDERLARFTEAPEREEPVMLAKDLLRDDRIEDALAVTRRALELDPEDGELWVAHAQVCDAAGDQDARRDSLARATEAEPGWAESWHRLLAILMEEESFEKAQRAVIAALDHHPTDSRLVCLRMELEELLDVEEDETEDAVVVAAAPVEIEELPTEPEPILEERPLRLVGAALSEEPPVVVEAILEEPPAQHVADQDDSWEDIELVLPAVRIKHRAEPQPAVLTQPPVVVVHGEVGPFDDDPELDSLLAALERETIVPAFRDTLPGVAAPATDDAPYAFGVARPRHDNGLRASAGRRPYYPPSPAELFPTRPDPVDDDSWAVL